MLHAILLIAPEQQATRTLWEWVLLVAGGITVVSGAGLVIWKVAVKPHFESAIRRLSAKTDEIHHQVTVNGDRSDAPTVLDYLTHLTGEVAHIKETAADTRARVASLEQHDSEHDRAGREYVALVRGVLSSHGIEIPAPPDPQQ